MLAVLILVPFFIQAVLMMIDEFRYHRARGLGGWERRGHPLDTLTVLACLLYGLAIPATEKSIAGYFVLGLFSSVFITKDETIHALSCDAEEHWVHALLFVVHPMVLGGIGAIAWLPRFSPLKPVLIAELAALCGFFVYQITYWNLYRARVISSRDTRQSR